MADETNASTPSTDGEAVQTTNDTTPEMSPSSTRSILGMGVVSTLNIACLLFIAYHFTTHGDEPATAMPLSLRSGNISFEPASGQLLTIASHVTPNRPDNREAPVERTAATRPAPPILPISPESTEPQDARDQWVQLGALSEMATARSYWEKLLKGHDSRLSLYKPSFISPDQVGGSLYHVRVGPLPAAEAAALCSDLQQAGTECFCVSADGKATDHETAKAKSALPAPS